MMKPDDLHDLLKALGLALGTLSFIVLRALLNVSDGDARRRRLLSVILVVLLSGFAAVTVFFFTLGRQ